MNKIYLIVLAVWLGLVGVPAASAHEFSGYVSGEMQLFPENPNHAGQRDQSASLAFQAEYYHEFKNGSSFTFVPFYRLDSADAKRTHFDIRELTYLCCMRISNCGSGCARSSGR